MSVYNLIVSNFGNPRSYNTNTSQLNVNCPRCAEYNNNKIDNKYNLEININKNVYRCWKCEDEMSGSLYNLFRYYTTKEDFLKFIEESKNYINISNYISNKKKKKECGLSLPTEFINFKDIDLNNKKHKWAYYYLSKERGLNIDMINNFDIGFCLEGRLRYRIVIPSYNKNGELNYYCARTFLKDAIPKYRFPDFRETGVSKFDVIFNESNIDFNDTVFLVEGVFEVFPFPKNTIPILGKVLSDVLLGKLIKYKPNVVICLNKDAIKNAKLIKNKLNSCGLLNVKILFMETDDDIADIYKNEKENGVLKIFENNK
jgi:hypothetical protein